MANKNTLGRQPGGTGEGPGGTCVCPKCGYTIKHGLGAACYRLKCPKCGTMLERKVTK